LERDIADYAALFDAESEDFKWIEEGVTMMKWSIREDKEVPHTTPKSKKY
jgi:hypothetical protein